MNLLGCLLLQQDVLYYQRNFLKRFLWPYSQDETRRTCPVYRHTSGKCFLEEHPPLLSAKLQEFLNLASNYIQFLQFSAQKWLILDIKRLSINIFYWKRFNSKILGFKIQIVYFNIFRIFNIYCSFSQLFICFRF